MNKLYSVHDHWTDINKKNDVDIESIDGVITGIKVNGEDYGGGITWESVYSGTIDPDGEVRPFTANVSLTMTAPDTIKVVYDNTEYVLPKQVFKEKIYYGATPASLPADIDFSNCPFLIQVLPNSIRVYTETAGTHTLTISEPASGGGSSDLSTAEVTVVNNYENAFTIHASTATDNDEMHASIPDMESSTIGNRTILKVILYKGKAIMRIGFALSDNPTVATSGNIQYIEIAHIYIITGDCTITIS